MSGLELALLNLAAWSVQVAALALAVAVAQKLAPIERPAPRLMLLQLLLALALLLPLLQPWRAVTPTVSASIRLGSQPAAAGPLAAPPHAAPAANASTLVLALLAAGALVQLGRLGLRLARLRALRRTARPFEELPWVAPLRMALAPAARIAVSDEVAGPATFGLRRPLVLLPTALLRLPVSDQRAVVMHELVHVRRRDWLALLVEELLAAALFFHPAVQWLLGRVRLAREQCVDAEVVSRLGGTHAYLESLVEVARVSARSRAVPAATFLSESHLRERVDLLLKEVSMSHFRTLAHVGLTAALLVLATSWAASAVPLQATEPKAATVDLRDDVKGGAQMKLVHKVNPAYPEGAKKEGVQGIYVLDIVIATDGSTKNVKVAASAPTAERLKELKPQKGAPAAAEGDKRLAEAAIAAVQQWRYEPILKDGKAVEARAMITVNFKLDK